MARNKCYLHTHLSVQAVGIVPQNMEVMINDDDDV